MLNLNNKKLKKMILIAKIFQIVAYWPALLFLKLAVSYKINGQENLKGLEDGPIIFASNHASYLDSLISAAAMPRQILFPSKFFPIRFLAKDKFLNLFSKYFLFAAYSKINASVKVFKAGGDLDLVLKDAVDALNNGSKLWIYPEGRMTTDGEIHSGKRGVAYLYKKSGVPIVPVGIKGHFGLFSTEYMYKLGTKVTINIGEPIFLPKDISLEEGVDIIMKKIKTLSGLK